VYGMLMLYSDDNPTGWDYWVHQTGTYSGQNTVTFYSDMRGISNPIVTTFASWPV